MVSSELMGRRMSELMGRRVSDLMGGAASGLMGRCPEQGCGVRTDGAASELMGRRVSELRGDVRTDGVVSEQIIPLLTQSLNRLMSENEQ